MGDHDPARRRTFLKVAGTAAVSGLAGCPGDGGPGPGEETPPGSPTPTPLQFGHEVPHPEDGTVPDAEANATALNGQSRGVPSESKSGIGFQHEPNGDRYCGNCAVFVPDRTDDGFGACLLVPGKIHHCDFCILHVPYDGEDVVSCER